MTDTVHADVVCPPNPEALCVCGEALEHHIPVDDPDAPITLGNAGCPDDAAAAFWKARPIQQFKLAAGDSLECDGITSCSACGAEMCTEHSDDFTTCVDTGLHHSDCSYECGPCNAATFEDANDDAATRAWKGDN